MRGGAACRAHKKGAGLRAGPAVFHAGQVSNPEQNAIVNGFPTSPYFPAATSNATSGSSSLSICSSRSIVDSIILSLPFIFEQPRPEVQSRPGPPRLSQAAGPTEARPPDTNSIKLKCPRCALRHICAAGTACRVATEQHRPDICAFAQCWIAGCLGAA
jgi:hypothetical protein